LAAVAGGRTVAGAAAARPSLPAAGGVSTFNQQPSGARLPLLGPRIGQDFVPTIVETVMA
jgi:hypothetical protein